MQVYLVGGAVRDRLLGREVSERDWVVVGATPAELSRAGFIPVGRDFPVFLHPDTQDEYVYKPKKGVNEDVVKDISHHKSEPEWMTKFRLNSLKRFEKKPTELDD